MDCPNQSALAITKPMKAEERQLSIFDTRLMNRVDVEGPKEEMINVE